MYYSPYDVPQYARCRVNKSRWFWVVFATDIDIWYFRAAASGYEKTAAAAEAKASEVAGPGARKARPYHAVDYLSSKRLGFAHRRAAPLPSWCITLGLTLPCGVIDVKTAYRRLAKAAHPDAGGKAEVFIAIESAYREALAYCQRWGPQIAS